VGAQQFGLCVNGQREGLFFEAGPRCALERGSKVRPGAVLQAGISPLSELGEAQQEGSPLTLGGYPIGYPITI